jgi:predicted RNA-binding protein with EMAP domain
MVMSRLIDADKLIEDLKEYVENIKNIRDDGKCFLTEENVLSIIKEQPVAFDVDKVVEQLEDELRYISLIEGLNYMEFKEAIDVVKAGGIDD